MLYPSRPFATERKRFAPKHGSCRVARLLCFSFLSWHGKSNAYHLCTSPQNVDTRVPYAFRCWERVGIPALYAAQIETLSRPRRSAFHHLPCSPLAASEGRALRGSPQSLPAAGKLGASRVNKSVLLLGSIWGQQGRKSVNFSQAGRRSHDGWLLRMG